MALLKTDKIKLVEELTAEIKECDALFLTDFKGLMFPQQDKVRRAIKASGNDFRVVKNTLLKKALNALDIHALDADLAGPTAVALVKGDVAAAAKELKNFSKEFDKFEIKAGYFDGVRLSKEDVITFADLPSREELLGRMLGSMNAPVTNFVSLLANIPRSFLNVLNAVKDKKGE